MVLSERRVVLNGDNICELFAKAYPGIGFAFSEAYEGKTVYDKIVMATEKAPKPKYSEFLKALEPYKIFVIEE